jgi:hypothetical protein
MNQLGFAEKTKTDQNTFLYAPVLLLKIFSTLKIKMPIFFKRGSMHSEVLFQMGLLANYSIKLIRPTCLTDVRMLPKNGI